MEIIFSRFGLSRERVRQVGLIAMEKLKHAARRKHLDALLEEYWMRCFSFESVPQMQWLYVILEKALLPLTLQITILYMYICELWQLIGMMIQISMAAQSSMRPNKKRSCFFFLGKLHKFCNICICNVSFSTLISRATFMSWICILLQLHESKNAYKIMVPTKFISEMCNQINPRINFWIS